jgi:maltose alpha-D-glucosyltransferase / alpha-amylase
LPLGNKPLPDAPNSLVPAAEAEELSDDHIAFDLHGGGVNIRDVHIDPLWYKDAIIYETHVKAFFDSNGDGIGDFSGLLQKLDYLSDLGITCVWLLPFFPSPLRDDGYDIADYTDVHPSYGTLDDFKKFLNAAHERGLKVIIELVINHTSDQHPWFQAARHAPPESPEREIYVWSDTEDKYRDARIIFTDTEKSNWTSDPVAKAYYWHRFFSHQPDLNFDNPKVLERVIAAMDFWLDMGVDGLRLDAIPYLVEREGTSCENLPQTHVVIKRIRKAVDERYPGRMLLAEANQWPTDVRPYFGDGDECHMAFHFPVMPRIFMALRMEDREPITDIMMRTPDIPPDCQWGLFLRNHDELTLEMVTVDERDYMYLAYSADPKMKLNVGIRRRLAPLMENNRRRIELLNSLLFSFPGTPIIYYGDEIGMGDNIYLGDRDGVRTPMQWNSDRNGGFSRANPGRLYSPVIMDPVYGYEAVNVEAELTDSSSLLHWMRNMISLRKLFKVFGRGTIEFLNPQNRKILAYLRRYNGDRILCVANLSRFAQAVELDLSAFEGVRPVEMFGYTEFPVIGRRSYQLSLNPYGFFWFELQESAVPSVATVPSAEAVTPLSARSWRELFESDSGETLESAVLPKFLPAQRWFAGKARMIDTVQIHDWIELTAAPSALVLLRVHYSDGFRETYFVPLAMTVSGADALLETSPERVLCRVHTASGAGVLYDGAMNDDACAALLAAIEFSRRFNSRRGIVRAWPSTAFADLRRFAGDSPSIRRGSAEQSNTSIFVGERFMLKLYRRLEPGINPDVEIGRYLTEKAGFEGIPSFAGAIEYVGLNGEVHTVALLQAAVENEGDGWKWMLDELSRYYEQCSEAGPDSSGEAAGLSRDAAASLGWRTAQLHMALADGDDPAFAPEPLGAGELERILDSARREAQRGFNLLEESLSRLPIEIIDDVKRLLQRRSELTSRLGDLKVSGIFASKQRIHGDYHLGQVLRARNDYVIIDFEGETQRPLAERRAKASPVKDVAGMMRSFSYAAYAGLYNHAARRPGEFAWLLSCARFWERQTASAFLDSYIKTSRGSSFLPSEPGVLERLLELFILEKAFYELSYELNNRPLWVRVPLQSLLDLGEDH